MKEAAARKEIIVEQEIHITESEEIIEAELPAIVEGKIKF